MSAFSTGQRQASTAGMGSPEVPNVLAKPLILHHDFLAILLAACNILRPGLGSNSGQ